MVQIVSLSIIAGIVTANFVINIIILFRLLDKPNTEKRKLKIFPTKRTNDPARGIVDGSYNPTKDVKKKMLEPEWFD